MILATATLLFGTLLTAAATEVFSDNMFAGIVYLDLVVASPAGGCIEIRPKTASDMAVVGYILFDDASRVRGAADCAMRAYYDAGELDKKAVPNSIYDSYDESTGNGRVRYYRKKGTGEIYFLVSGEHRFGASRSFCAFGRYGGYQPLSEFLKDHRHPGGDRACHRNDFAEPGHSYFALVYVFPLQGRTLPFLARKEDLRLGGVMFQVMSDGSARQTIPPP